MRVIVVGATGNAGTAVLNALQQTPEISSILGIARRMPNTNAAPYEGCEWTSIDIAAASEEDDAIGSLTQAFEGADAVIHLAWLIQPNSQRDLLRRVNVEGTKRVALAVAKAGVAQLVVASSVGAYSADDTGRPRDESWPTGGTPTSHYAVDKAAQERVLDEFSADYPDVVVTRLRPALTFQPKAASQIQRYFLGSWIPVQALRAGRPPVLPIPKGLRTVQAVHADDLGQAYAAAVVKKAAGAFNICSDDVLGPQALADIVNQGHYVEVPARLVRSTLAAGHKTKVVAADEGWIDMALAVPVMDNSRAKQELDWQPEHTGAKALRQLLDGMAQGQGTESVPMRPRDLTQDTSDASQQPDSLSQHSGADSTGISDNVPIDLITLYLSDHLTGATAGVERIERMSAAFIDTPIYPRLSELAEEIRREHAFVERLIHDFDLKQLRHRQAAAWAGERIGRLKINGRLTQRSPMTLVLETELMRSAVMGKIGMWQTLEDNAGLLGVNAEVFAERAQSSHRQLEALEEIHAYARQRAFDQERETFGPSESDGAANNAKTNNS